MSLMLCLVILQQCRTSDFTDSEKNTSEQSETAFKKGGDSIRNAELYPDPPVRDGHDWKNSF